MVAEKFMNANAATTNAITEASFPVSQCFMWLTPCGSRHGQRSPKRQSRRKNLQLGLDRVEPVVAASPGDLRRRIDAALLAQPVSLRQPRQILRRAVVHEAFCD